MKRILFIFPTAALLFLAVAAWGNPELKASLASIDFGHIGVDYNLYQTVEINNTGSSELVISDVYPSCDCSRTWVADTIVQPGESTTVRLKFNTKNWYGVTEQYFSIESNDPKLPTIKIPYHSLVGQWVKGIYPKPKAIFFLPGKSQAQLEIANTKYDLLELELIDQADPFFRVAIAQNSAEKGDKLLIKVIVDESLSKGTHESSFRLRIIAAGRKEPVILSIPVKIVKY